MAGHAPILKRTKRGDRYDLDWLQRLGESTPGFGRFKLVPVRVGLGKKEAGAELRRCRRLGWNVYP